MESAAAEAYFRDEFEVELSQVGSALLDRFRPILKSYKEVIIPFERKRVLQHQSIIFENSSLQQNKLELMGKIDRCQSQNEKLEHALELQRTRINEYEKKIEELETTNMDNLSVIESLRIRNEDYKEAIESKNKSISQLEKDKAVLLEKYQDKEKQYNLVLANCIRDKNMMAEKLNHLNQLEQAILDKQKEIKAEQFYLKKQWEELEESKKKEKQTPSPPPVRNPSKTEFVRPAAYQEELLYGKEEEEKKVVKDSNAEILRSPLRKLVKHHQSQIYEIALNYNGNLLATCGGDRAIRTLDVNNMRNISTINTNSAESVFISVAMDYSGERLLAGSTDKTVSIYHTQTGKHLHSFLGHGGKVNSVSWSSSRERCVSGSDDKQVKVWDIQKASNVFSVSCGRGVKVVRSNHVQPVVYTGHADGSVRVYSITQGTSPVSKIQGIIDYSITSLTLLSNRHQVLVSSLQGSTIHLLDLKMNKSVGKYDHKDFFNSAAHATISPSENLVLSGNCDGSIYYWNRYKGGLERKVTGHEGSVTAIQYHFMSSLLASADKEGNMILWT